jgi:hypothetical protein
LTGAGPVSRQEQDDALFRRRSIIERSSYHLTVVPSGFAATFTAGTGGSDVDVSWSPDRGVVTTAREQLIADRAARELRVALGDRGVDGGTPRPSWMGSFLWVPPLPDAPAIS